MLNILFKYPGTSPLPKHIRIRAAHQNKWSLIFSIARRLAAGCHRGYRCNTLDSMSAAHQTHLMCNHCILYLSTPQNSAADDRIIREVIIVQHYPINYTAFEAPHLMGVLLAKCRVFAERVVESTWRCSFGLLTMRCRSEGRRRA